MDWKQLLESITESVDEEVRLRNACLYAENCILRQQIPRRMQLPMVIANNSPSLGTKLGRKALAEIATLAKPDTILAWHRTLADQQVDSSIAAHVCWSSPHDQELKTFAVRMARENRSWGYDRIGGALANLGYTISDQTVGNILKRHGIPPAPTRKKTTTWNEFIRAHMAMLVAIDSSRPRCGIRSGWCWPLCAGFSTALSGQCRPPT